MTAAGGWQRRALLQGCAVAIGTLAAGGGALGSAQAAAAPASSPPVTAMSGSLVAWVQLRSDHVRVSLAHFGPDGTLLGQAADVQLPMPEAVAGGAMTTASGLAGKLARKTVARSWGVDATECDLLPSRIVQRSNGRSIGYAVWVDVV